MRSARSLLPVPAIAACVLAAAASAQTPTWKAELLGAAPPSWSGAAALAVNDAGQATGNTTVALIRRPWIGAPGTGLQLLPLPAGTTYADAFDLNSAGVVAGRVLVNGGASRAAIWRPGASGYEVVLLPSGPNGQLPSDARGINDRGDVVGKYGLFASYVWNEATGVTVLTGFPVVPEDINNQRQVVADTYRMDIDTMVVENLGNPTGTGFNYIFSDLWRINDAGECGGYGNVATGQSRSKQAVRFTDGLGWKAFNRQPAISANVMGLAASGDTAFHTGAGAYGSYIHVEGRGSISLPNTLAPAYASWDLSGSFAPVISRNGRIACTGANRTTGESGIVLLTPLPFDDLGGASAGALGTPVLSGYGALTAGLPVRLRLASAALQSPAFLAVSTTTNAVPLFGGVFHPDLASGVIAGVATDALGRFEITFAWPAAPAGVRYTVQAGALDTAATAGVALSNALQG